MASESQIFDAYYAELADGEFVVETREGSNEHKTMPPSELAKLLEQKRRVDAANAAASTGKFRRIMD